MSKQAIEMYRQAILGGLDGLRSMLKDGLTEGDVLLEERLDVAFLLWDTIQAAKEGLEPIKGALRDRVADQPPGVVKFAGVNGRQSVVTIPQAKYVVRKGVVPKDVLSHLLDEEELETLFAEKTTITPNREAIEEMLEEADDALKDALVRVLDQQTPTIRISFRRDRR